MNQKYLKAGSSDMSGPSDVPQNWRNSPLLGRFAYKLRPFWADSRPAIQCLRYCGNRKTTFLRYCFDCDHYRSASPSIKVNVLHLSIRF